MIFGNITSFPPSRFLSEIPAAYLEEAGSSRAAFGSRGYTSKPAQSFSKAQSAYEILQSMTPQTPKAPPAAPVAPRAAGTIRPDMTITWRPGDKVRHGAWGIGTVISVEGSGEETMLKVAFPDRGVKGLMQKYAPICRAK